jgi:hypothetical protein
MKQISHNINDESIEAKALWFRALPILERMERLSNFTDLALELNPDLAGKKDAQPIKGRWAPIEEKIFKTQKYLTYTYEGIEVLQNINRPNL